VDFLNRSNIYVDDILLATLPNLFDNILETFNSFHDKLKFTIEIGGEDPISFLDVILIIKNGKIIFNLSKKSTNSGR